MKKIKEGVFSCGDQSIIKIGHNEIDQLIEEAKSADLRCARVNIHKSADDLLHEMIIAFTSESEVKIHKHPNKRESFHIIRGRVQIQFYDEDLVEMIDKKVIMCSENGPYFYRMQDQLWHKVVPLSDICVIHEITDGPFILGQSSIFPENNIK